MMGESMGARATITPKWARSCIRAWASKRSLAMAMLRADAEAAPTACRMRNRINWRTLPAAPQRTLAAM